MEYESKLREDVERLLSGDWDVSRFRDSFYEFYVERVPEGTLRASADEFFSAAQEKLDWTDANPDEESRAFGWISEEEYVEWLRVEYAKFLARV